MKGCITLFLVILLGSFSLAQGLNGKWKGNVSTPNGDMELVFNFKATDASLTGDITSAMGSIPIENGKVNGNEFSYDININGSVFSNSGKLEGDIIKISNPMMEEGMILNRVSDKSKIDGKWNGTASSPQGEFKLTFTFAVDGNKLTGKNSSDMGEVDLTNGVVNGNDFSFDVDMGGMVISHKCKYMPDDSIEVKALVMENEMIMKLTRASQ
ncbi:MAG: hypothetical protein GXX85_16070 [Ignavibacteria bacterium]|nr:hypothetical protein [Ignavibacteria bacterium]